MRLLPLLIVVLSLPQAALGQDRPAQVEFTSPVNLLSAQGELEAWGWARRAQMIYNRDAIPAARLPRVKEWEHYTVMSPEFTVGVTIVQIGALTIGSAEVIDYGAESIRSAFFVGQGSKDRSIFPADPYGATELRSERNSVALKFDRNRRLISFRFAKSATNPALQGEIELTDDPATDSIALARPFDEPGQFFYENKIFGMPAKGTVLLDDKSYSFPDGDSFAIYDWGRGIWPSRSQWFWGYAAGNVGGRRVAINLGHGYGDDSHGTANAILVDGQLHKLRDVPCEFDPEERMKPWHFASDDGNLTLTFHSRYHQQSKQELLIGAAELHKVHGHYSGKLVVDGQVIEIKDLLGFAEHMSQRW